MIAKAFGVDVRTVRNWKARAEKGERHFPFDNEGYYPFDNSRHWRERWLLVAQAKKLHNQFIESRVWDKVNASVVLHGICPDHIADPEKARLWRDARPHEFAHPAAAKAIEPENELELVAATLRLTGKDVSRQTIAEALGVSVRSLYRRSDVGKLRKLCPTVKRRKPLIESKGKLHDLAA